MPIVDPGDGFFYPTLILMVDTYNHRAVHGVQELVDYFEILKREVYPLIKEMNLSKVRPMF